MSSNSERRHRRKNEPRQRMSSYEMRQKQKQYIAKLEARVGELTSSNADYQSQLHQLSSENQRMKDELAALRSCIAQSVHALPPEAVAAHKQRQPCKQPLVGSISRP